MGITILGAPGGSESYTLTDSTTESALGNSIVISLSATDANALKNVSFATSAADTFISVANITIQDLAFVPNSVAPINETDPLGGSYTADHTSPELSSFSLDLNTDYLTLEFNEPINTDTIDFSRFTISGSMLVNAPSVSLSFGRVVSSIVSATHTIVVALDASDLIALKTMQGVATTESNTFISVVASAVTDVTGNGINTIDHMPVDSFTADSIKVRLLSFTLDMVEGTLYLTFDDVVIASTFNPMGIVLQSNISRADGTYYRLTEAS